MASIVLTSRGQYSQQSPDNQGTPRSARSFSFSSLSLSQQSFSFHSPNILRSSPARIFCSLSFYLGLRTKKGLDGQIDKATILRRTKKVFQVRNNNRDKKVSNRFYRIFFFCSKHRGSKKNCKPSLSKPNEKQIRFFFCNCGIETN